MDPFLIWTFAIGMVTAAACALCGVFLVVKREAFIAEGLSHAVLPGIILAFIAIPDRSSPLLVLAAGLSGLLMVWLVKWISDTRLVDKDAALGIVFSGLFCIGVIVSSLKLGNVHFHAHCIIDGNLSFAALKTLNIGGVSLGPKAFWTITAVLILLALFVTVFYKELQLVTFDETSANLFGFRPRWLHSLWLSLVSLTAVASFETAGTILVVALMVTPPATANLLTKKLGTMIWLSIAIAIACSVGGLWLSHLLDVSSAGLISAVSGLFFLSVAIGRAFLGRTPKL